MIEKIDPIVITIEDKTYTLEFSRETVAMAEKAGFSKDDAGDKLMTRVPELFFYAFMMHHPQVSRKKTDSILFDDLGGISAEVLGRLIDLYDAPYATLISTGEVKNPKATISL